MKPEAQRIAIAEACGWTWVHNHYFKNESFMGSRTYGNGWKNPKTKQVSDDPDELPDYLNDLNAIHEAEKVLWSNDPDDESLDGMVGKYRQTLENLVIRDWNLDHDLHRWSEHATATQRCEAFLRTIEKWVTE